MVAEEGGCRPGATRERPHRRTLRHAQKGGAMARLALCGGDPLLETLRDVFDATPLRVPEDRVTTLCVVATDGRHSRFLGAVEPLLSGDGAIDVPAQESLIASLTGK